MPWKVTDPMSERVKFMMRLLDGERMSDLCTEYGISRKTGYKFKDRYETLGMRGLFDVSRRPKRSRRMAEELQELLLKERRRHPSWGPKKLRRRLEKKHAGVRFPALSTIGSLFSREGLVVRRRRRRRVESLGTGLSEAVAPNDIWCADYKGQFRMGNRNYCYPLTITDQMSRYIIGCVGFERIESDSAQAVFEEVFARYGVPRMIRTDNGVPFAGRGLFGLTRLSVFWMKQGIGLERIDPGAPQQNGRHERMHRTLKAETTRPAAANVLQQQERFDRFVDEFNQIRPHEALDQEVPGSVYTPSLRPYKPADLEYPFHDDVLTVTPSGHLRILRGRQQIFLAGALAGEDIGLRELPDGTWLLTFADIDLGHVEPSTWTFHPKDSFASAPPEA